MKRQNIVTTAANINNKYFNYPQVKSKLKYTIMGYNCKIYFKN